MQYKLLEAIYSSSFGENLVFIGGTSIHIIYGNTRFSEDLDFDNQGLDKNDFEKLSKHLQTQIKREGLDVETKVVIKNAYHIFFYFTRILQEMRLTGHKNAKLLIRIDAEPQNYNYAANSILLNKFDVFQKIRVAHPSLLLAQKIATIFERKRPMGRDFFDVTFLYPNHEPDYRYLKKKLGISDLKTLKKRLFEHCKSLKFNQLSLDVAPFLYHSQDKKRVEQFLKFVKSI
ncbi:MAG: nucleotidyl transferase AbiEii/AbiGii toxin family protein [Bdellovibrio sp.]|nr:nucleotidyl transferase AbiEii/AbiGii toxin family protein [Bdellovibrio sp.]